MRFQEFVKLIIMASETDPFDDILTLEDTLYTAAYDLGASDGAHAGRIEVSLRSTQ